MPDPYNPDTLAEFNGKRWMRLEQRQTRPGVCLNVYHLKTEEEYQALSAEDRKLFYPLRMRHKQALWSVQGFKPWLLKPIPENSNAQT